MTCVVNRRTCNSQAGKFKNFEERVSGLLIKSRWENDPFHVVTLYGVNCKNVAAKLNDVFLWQFIIIVKHVYA